MVLALTDVETVALWAGLLVGVASVVLAIVAIYFSIEVDRRSSATAAETIRSLERIESAAKSQSQDTRDLIKVGWERMLPPAGGLPRAPASEEGIREVAAGLAAEIRSELGLVAGEQGDDDTSAVAPDRTTEQNEELIQQLTETIETSMRATRGTAADEVQFWLDQLSNLSEESQALARALTKRQITARQWRELRRDPVLQRGFSELRRAGILIPLEGIRRDGRPSLVYWFPPGAHRAIRAATLLLPDPPPELISYVESSLERVGYPDLAPPDKEEREAEQPET